MKYEIILFDADETLYDFKKSERRKTGEHDSETAGFPCEAKKGKKEMKSSLEESQSDSSEMVHVLFVFVPQGGMSGRM